MVLLGVALTGCLSRGAVLAERIDAGRPLEDPGPDAYLVWHDSRGWHLRARSDVLRTFHGRIETWSVSRVRSLAVPRGAVLASADDIEFTFQTRTGEAGFDWNGTGCQGLELYVDGESRPLRVFAGRAGASPTRVPFVLCP